MPRALVDRGGCRQLSPASGKVLKADGPEPEDSAARNIRRGAGGPSLFLTTPLPAVLGTQGPWSWWLGRMLPCPSPTSNWTPILSGWDSQRNGHFQGVAKEGRINGAKYPFRRYGERGGLCWEMAGRNPDRDAGWSGGRAGGMCVVGCAADTGGQLMKRRTLGPVTQ